MNITREWIIASRCNACRTLMPAHSFLQEQHFPESPNMPEQWFLSAGITQGAGPLTCPNCGKVHEPPRVMPEMIRVNPGTTEPVEFKRRPVHLSHCASVGEWKRVIDLLPLRTHAPLIDKILWFVRDFESDDQIMHLYLTLDDQIAISRVLEDNPAASG